MYWLIGARGWLRRVVLRGTADRETDQELRFHVDMETEKNIREGASPAEARRMALAAFGGEEKHREAIRDGRRLPVFESLLRDIRYSLRSLRRTPGFTLVATLILAIGIGAATAIYSATYAVLLSPLPVQDLDRIVELKTDLPRATFEGGAGLRPHEVYDLMERRDLFAALAGYLFRPVNLNLTALDEPRQVAALPTVGPFFQVFGVSAHLGRVYDSSDLADGNTRVVVLSYGFWRDFAGEDPGVVGGTIQLSNETFEVLGVLPPGFQYPRDAQMWTPYPLQTNLLDPELGRCCHNVRTIARLQPGVTQAQLQHGLASAKRAWVEEWPALYRFGEVLRTTPLVDSFSGPLRPILLLLLGATAILLLIACANVASLQLIRALARKKELAVRVALGASRRSVVKHVALETLLVALAGGALGLAIGWLLIRLIGRLASAQYAIPGLWGLYPPVLLFGAAVTVFASFLAALVPAIRSGTVDPGLVLQRGTRGASAGREVSRFLQILVMVQVALTMTLLLTAGVAITSLERILATDPGFDPDGVIAMNMILPTSPGETLEDPEAFSMRGENFYDGLLGRLSEAPGVEMAATVAGGPFSYVDKFGLWRTGVRAAESDPEIPAPLAVQVIVSPDYFRLMDIPLLAGRAFTEDDTRHRLPPVAIVDERLAQELFPGRQPLGQELQAYGRIVGVVGSVKTTDLTGPVESAVYIPFRQFPGWEQTLLVRTTDLSTAAVAGLAESVVAEMEPGMAVFDVRRLSDSMKRTLGPQYLAVGILGAVGPLALILAGLGIYGVLSFSVSSRARELGIRLALGATPHNVTRGVVFKGVVLAGVGLLAGTLLFTALQRLLSALMLGVRVADPQTLLGGAGILVSVAILASLAPALRASRADPAVALREE